MKKLFVFLISVITVFLYLCVASAEDQPGIVAKVTTKKGPLKMRESAETKGRVLTEIPNGTCILVLQEDKIWCQVSYQDQPGYCGTEFLTLLREADPAMLEYRVLQKGAKGDDVLALKQLAFLRNQALRDFDGARRNFAETTWFLLLSAKQVQTPLQGVCTMIERTDFESRRVCQWLDQIVHLIRKNRMTVWSFFIFDLQRSIGIAPKKMTTFQQGFRRAVRKFPEKAARN